MKLTLEARGKAQSRWRQANLLLHRQLNRLVSGSQVTESVEGWALTAQKKKNSLEYCLYSASYKFQLTKPQVMAHTLAVVGGQ